jgi:hypothetical protein
MLLPGETHRESVDGKIDVGDDRTLFNPRRSLAPGTSHVLNDLLDAQFHVCGATLVVQNAHVF